MPLLPSCPLPPHLDRTSTLIYYQLILLPFHHNEHLVKICGQLFWFDEQVLRDTSDFFAPFLGNGWKVSTLPWADAPQY